MDDGIFKCPLSQEIFRDPVTLDCGHTFEREYIEYYLQKYKYCPTKDCHKRVTNCENLETNIGLKELVQKSKSIIVQRRIHEKTKDNEKQKKNKFTEDNVDKSGISGLIINEYEQLNEKYEIHKRIGKGSFGEAILARDVETGEKKVLKAMKLSHVEKDDVEKAINDVKKEACVMNELDHPNILKFYECFQTFSYLCIVSEYCEGGDLTKVLQEYSNKKAKVSHELMIEWFSKLLDGLNYLHKNKIIHRDIKPENILFKEGEIKIADFGVAKQTLKIMKLQEHTKLVGTLLYMSPEMLLEKDYNNKTDIWSMGCVFYNIYFLTHPFNGSNEKQLKESILKCKLDRLENINDDIASLIKSMLCHDVSVRPLVDPLLQTIAQWTSKADSNYKSTNYHRPTTLAPNIARSKEDSINDSRDLHKELQRILTCPLTNEIFKEPVMLNCGHTFEKNPLKSRLNHQRACPYENCNRTPITLAPNEKLIKVMNLLKKHEENNKKLELDNKSNNIKSADVTKKSSNNQAKNIEPVIINDNNILFIRLGCGHDFLLKNLYFWFDRQTSKCPKCYSEITPGLIDKLKAKMNLEDRNALSPLANAYKLENKENNNGISGKTFQENDLEDDRLLTRQDDQTNQSQISDNRSDASNSTITLPCGHKFTKYYVDWLLGTSKTCMHCPTPIPNDILFKRTISNETSEKVPSPKSKKEPKKKDNLTGEMSDNTNPIKHDTINEFKSVCNNQ